MRNCRTFMVFCLLLTALSGAGCGSSGSGNVASARVSALARWTGHEHVGGVVDLGSPFQGAQVLVAAAGRLEVLRPGARISRFAPGYAAPSGLEPYIALSSGQRVQGASCRFPKGAVYALRLNRGPGVVGADSRGTVRRLARLPSRGLENGIAFDATGHFGHRLLVSSSVAGSTTIYAIDCRGRAAVLARRAPRLEGGLVVAPASFGRYGGELIAPDEVSGRLYAIDPNGHATVVASSGLPHGQDIGVESEGFVPSRYQDALVADRRTPHNRHPGDDLILGLSRATLTAAGVSTGDLLAVSEGGASTIAVSCARNSCLVRHIAGGPGLAHVEGHVVFSASVG